MHVLLYVAAKDPFALYQLISVLFAMTSARKQHNCQ